MGAIGSGTNGRPAEYPVAWRTPGGVLARGSFRLEQSGLLLRGSTADGAIVRQRVRLGDVVSVEIGRSAGERVQGARSVVLRLRGGRSVAVAPVGASEVLELAELVAELSAREATAAERVAIVLPLRRGTAERARELVAAGPPFDLDDAGLERHQVFVSDREAVFVFEGPQAREALERLLRSPRVLGAATRWRECLAGPPRLAAESYAWRRDT
ncbi:MAG TPA: hypothetical protein VE995_05580 [Gaiellaceae bacterium]|nr:hypothetical protein [Gaiellaceae bacterium]